MNFTIKLSADDVRKAIKDYLFANGYSASINDIKLRTSIGYEGHMLNDKQIAVFDGAEIFNASLRNSKRME